MHEFSPETSMDQMIVNDHLRGTLCMSDVDYYSWYHLPWTLYKVQVQLRVQKCMAFRFCITLYLVAALMWRNKVHSTHICLSVVLGRRWRVCTVLVSFSIYELIYATTQESRVHRRKTLALTNSYFTSWLEESRVHRCLTNRSLIIHSHLDGIHVK